MRGRGRFGVTVPPHFKDGSVYRQLRPTRLDKIKNFHPQVQISAVALPEQGATDIDSLSLGSLGGNCSTRQDVHFLVN